MTTQQVLEVPLPDGARMTDEEIELLEEACRSLVALHRGEGPQWKSAMQKLRSEGWQVSIGLAWLAEARRGKCCEQAVGRTRDETLTRLSQLTMLDAVEGCP